MTRSSAYGQFVILGVLVLTLGAGCAAGRQGPGDLNAALHWFAPTATAQGWPQASEGDPGVSGAPAVVIAWVRPASPEPEARGVVKAVRTAWTDAIQRKINRSGATVGSAVAGADRFDDGVSLEDVRALAQEHGANVVILFGVQVNKRRYHSAGHVPTSHDRGDRPSTAAGAAPPIATVITEVLVTARSVGLTGSGRPLFAETATGFDSEASHLRTVDELEETAGRVAVDALGSSIADRLRKVRTRAGAE